MESTTTDQSANTVLTPKWSLPSGVNAFYTNRLGGFSRGQYASSNLAMHVGDKHSDVHNNRQLLPKAEHIAWLKQTHSSRCVEITPAYFLSLEYANADASFTRSKAQVCGVLTADCLPILIASSDCVAAVHAGWRGLASGVLQNTIKAMKINPADLTIWVGPHISRAHFQVSDEVVKAFAHYRSAFTDDPREKGKYLCDLFQITEQICHQLSIESVTNSGICTYRQHQQFYSYRHANHQGQAETGRFFSGIYLT